jgi:peptidoglycan hydrolase-like protein with peptidoglycan-binding domain
MQVLLGPVRSTTPRGSRQPPADPPPRRKTGRILLGVGAILVGIAAVAFFAVRALSGVSLTSDPTGLARVDVHLLGGKLTSAHAVDSHGTPIPLAIHDGLLTPMTKVRPGETITVNAVVTRPGVLSWALGSTQHERLTVRAPEAKMSSKWISVDHGAALEATFDHPVTRVVVGTGAHRREIRLRRPQTSVVIPHHAVTGTLKVAAAPRAWEHAGTAVRMTYFPSAHETVAVGDPTPGSRVAPVSPIRITFSTSVADALGSARPTLTPNVPGHWTSPNSHTLEFRPSGAGLALDSRLTVHLPRLVAVVGPAGHELHRARNLTWTVPPGSLLRVQQILAQKGYLPVKWTPTGKPVAHTIAAEARAAVEPPAGTFTWRYHHTPPELKAQWTPGTDNEVTRGAVMTFQNASGLATDAEVGPSVWRALLAAAVHGTGTSPIKGYSYVFVHKAEPQKLSLWHSGHVIITSPGNTGVPAAPTQNGTFPVFEHLPETTMSGTNPDGTTYHDPGIKWVSYFNGGDALHAFPRASFGTPQSLGCVELPLASAAAIYPYTPIGTLVTIEN